jgi:hypothetical protein
MRSTPPPSRVSCQCRPPWPPPKQAPVPSRLFGYRAREPLPRGQQNILVPRIALAAPPSRRRQDCSGRRRRASPSPRSSSCPPQLRPKRALGELAHLPALLPTESVAGFAGIPAAPTPKGNIARHLLFQGVLCEARVWL